MIKYHPTFIGRLIFKQIVKKTKYRLELNKNNHIVNNGNNKNDLEIEDKRDYIKFLSVDNNGVKRINYCDYDRNEQFVKIKLFDEYSVKDIIKFGIEIYNVDSYGDICCHFTQLNDLVSNFSEELLDLKIPEKCGRFKGLAKEKYIAFLEKYVRFLSDGSEYVKTYTINEIGAYQLSYHEIIGFDNYWDKCILQKKENIKKYGVFAHSAIYKRIEWDFEMVELFKDQIKWRELINLSNLVWSEEKLVQYDSYIPYCNPKAERYYDKFKEQIDYSKFGFLSNAFLDKHKDCLEWREVLEKCNFEWNEYDVKYFCEFILNIDSIEPKQMEWSLHVLFDNPNFKWNSKNLIAFLSISDYLWKSLVSEHRPKIFRIIRNIPNIRDIAAPYISEINNFWDIIYHNKKYPYDELNKDFTVENIIKNINEWSTPIKDIFKTTRRTPDTNYTYYDVETQWDIYKQRVNIPLTYEIAKLLHSKEIEFGGSFVESDGGYIEEDYRHPLINGLLAFSEHHFLSLEDAIKCYNDIEMRDVFLNPMNPTNLDLVDMLISYFLYNYSLEDYLWIINKFKDWDNINHYY